MLEYEWDDAQDENTRTHSFKNAVQLCGHHKALEASKAYDTVLSENTRKNIVFDEAQKIRPDITLNDYAWSFEGTGENRKLKVGFPGKMMADEKSSLSTLCDGKFGAGKVEVI